MENTEKKLSIADQIKEAQKIIDDLKTAPQYAQYIKQRKLHLINPNLSYIDNMLMKGILK